MPVSEVKCCDCMDFMAQFPDKFFDLAIVDPPYGIGVDGQKLSINKNPKHSRKAHKQKEWDRGKPEKKYFEELERVSKNQIIWGGNYFVPYLRQSKKGWIVWDKGQYGLTMSDCELAYSSFDCPTRIYKLNRMALKIEGTIHPTQKPVALYVWLLENYANPGDKILDTHMGSQSSRIAAWKMGFDYWGCEIDQEYFDQGCARFEEERRQLNLFTHPEKPKQEALF